MANDLQETLNRIAQKAAFFSEKYNAVLGANREAKAQIEALNQEINKLKKELQQEKQENEYLRIAHTVALSHEDFEKSRATLSRLVREINKCINQLKD